MWTCQPGPAWSKLRSVSCSSRELCKQQVDSSFRFFPSFYLKLSFLQGENENWFAVCFQFNSDQFKNILVGRLQGAMRYPRNLLKTCEVNCRNFTVPVSWWCSLFFFFLLKWYPWIHFCESLSLDLLVGSEDWFLCKAPPCPCLADWINNIFLYFWHIFVFVLAFKGEEETWVAYLHPPLI